MTEQLQRAAEILRRARHVLVFTGAGVSAESGIPTFRDETGLWSRFPPEQYASPQGLLAVAMRNPRRAAEFVHALLEPIASARPNAAHRAIADLQRYAEVTVVTQNIDGLHQEAGSHCVWEVHGSAFSVVTLTGEPVRRIERQELQEIVDRLHGAIHPVFDRSTAWQAVLPIISVDPERICRPNIVLFGEAMAEPDWSRATEAAEECDCLLMVGTSGVVYPAAMLPEQAKSAGADIIAVDPARGFCDVWLQGTAATMLPKLVGWIEDEVQD